MKLWKFIGCYFSYNKTLQQEKHFKKNISKIENVWKAKEMGHLTLEGKINVSKLLVILKIIHLKISLEK